MTSVSETVLETTAKEEDVIFDFSSYDTAYENVDTGSLTIKHGELLSVIYSDGTVIVKAKIEPSYNRITALIPVKSFRIGPSLI